MKRFFLQILLLVSVFSASAGPSTATSTAEDTLAHIRAHFIAQFPNVPLQGIVATPFPDVYELHIGDEHGDNLIYTNAQVDYLMQGALIDTQSRTDLTEQRLDVLTRIEFAEFPLDLSIHQVQGSGKDVLVIFEDPNCRYCKQLQQTLAGIEDLTIYTFLLPILSEDSVIKAHNIWCAPNRVQVWHDWMRNNQVPPSAQCEHTPIQEVLALGQKLRIRGTPAIYFADGSHVGGALPLESLRQKLAQVEKNLHSR